LAAQRDRDERAEKERQERSLAQARAELETVRRGWRSVACASPSTRRLARPAFVCTLEDLFGNRRPRGGRRLTGTRRLAR
jgi:hypothetical protein